MSENRAYVAAHFALDYKGKIVGFCRSVDGGTFKAEVLSYQTSGSPMSRVKETWRYIGKPKFEDISVQVGMAMSEQFFSDISLFFTGEAPRFTGAIVVADFTYAERARRTFKEALITEVQMPAADASDKNSCFMTVKISPELLTYESKSGGTKITASPGAEEPAKRWLAANFNFTIDGLLPEGNRVQKVDGFTIKQQILDYHNGRFRYPTKVAGRIEYPNMTFYLPEVDAAPLIKELDLRLNKNVPKSGKGRTGHLTWMASDKKTELCKVDIFGIDVVSIEPEKVEATSDSLHRVKVGIHVENMKFNFLKPGKV